MQNFVKLLILLSYISVGNIAFSQDNSPLNQSFGSSENTFSLLNPNKLMMNQSVSFITSSRSGVTNSFGMYSNFFNYQVNPKLNISTGIHLIQPTSSVMFENNNNLTLNYDFRLNYRFSDNFQFEMNISNLGLRNHSFRNYLFNHNKGF